MNNINEAPEWLQNVLKQQSEAILALADHVKNIKGGEPGVNDKKPETNPLKEIEKWAKSREEEAKQWKNQQQ